MNNWFTVDKIDDNTYVISEYGHWEETHCYLILGEKRALLIDTGIGICDIGGVVRDLTSKPVIAIPTHVHWDHIGGLSNMPDFMVHSLEAEWITDSFPLPIKWVRTMVARDCSLPPEFDINSYNIYTCRKVNTVCDGETIDLGGRSVRVLHTPGHSPGHLCFFEEERGYLFTGDLIYKGTLYANYPSTDPEAFLSSVERIAMLDIKRLLPAHHDLDVDVRLVAYVRDALRQLRELGELHHGSGFHDFGEFSMLL